MKKLSFVLVLLFGLAVGALAQTVPTSLVWDRNVESDMGVYKVFTCNTSATCVPGTTPADQLGADVPQPAAGTNPTMLIPPGTTGRAAVMAIDITGNRSGLSNIVNFDRVPPPAPTGLRFQ